MQKIPGSEDMTSADGPRVSNTLAKNQPQCHGQWNGSATSSDILVELDLGGISVHLFPHEEQAGDEVLQNVLYACYSCCCHWGRMM